MYDPSLGIAHSLESLALLAGAAVGFQGPRTVARFPRATPYPQIVDFQNLGHRQGVGMQFLARGARKDWILTWRTQE